MADTKLTDLTALTAVAAGDFFYVVDISDTTDDAAGSSKKITRANLITAVANVFTVEQSCPGAGSNSERFGASTTAAGSDSVAIGKSAAAATNNSTLIGSSTVVGTGTGHTIIGKGATTSGSAAPNCVAIGKDATISADGGGGGSVVIGGGSSFGGANGVIVGNGVNGGGANGTVVVGTTITHSVGALSIGNQLSTSNAGAINIGLESTVTHVGVTALGGQLVSSRRNELIIGHGPTGGSGSNTGGHRIRYMLESSTGTMRDGAILDNTWATATDASRKGRLTLYACDASGTDREGIRIESDGSLPMLGFYGVTAITRAVLATGTGATVDNVITALQNLGLVKQS